MNTYEEKVFDVFENDIQLFYCGKRLHNLSHHYGPHDRDTYLLYYVKEGKAKLCINGREDMLTGPAFFVNFPNSQTEYTCIDNIPWSIKWMVADGAIIETYLSLLGITRNTPFLSLKDSQSIETVFDEMYELFDKGTLSSKAYCISLVHKLFSLLFEKMQPVQKGNEYVSAALELIEKRFSEHSFNVATLAECVGLNANYFSILFKKETGKTPVKALCEYRLETACKMLKFTNRSVKGIAHSCGFTDELYFSRVFKNKYGISPVEYRSNEEFLT